MVPFCSVSSIRCTSQAGPSLFEPRFIVILIQVIDHLSSRLLADLFLPALRSLFSVPLTSLYLSSGLSSQMQIRQLQAQFEECCQLLKTAKKASQKFDNEKKQAENLKRAIRQNRIEIASIQHSLRKNMVVNSSKKESQRQAEALAKQIKNTDLINMKIDQQYRQTMNVCSSIRKKIQVVDNKINEAQRELAQLDNIKKQIEMSKSLEDMYWQLRNQLQTEMMTKMEAQEKYSNDYNERRRLNLAIQNTINQIDRDYIDIDEKVRIQKELISQVLLDDQRVKQENAQKDEEDNEKVQFPATARNNLDPFDKFEIEKIFLKKEFNKKEEEVIYGRIIKQRDPNQFIGRIINCRDRQYNYSDFGTIRHSKTQPTPSQLKPIISTQQRLQNLEKKKRVRTRQSEMRRFSSQFKSMMHQKFMSPSRRKAPKRSILQVYEELKKQSKPMIRKISNNIEVIKLLKRKKKKIPQQERGSITEVEMEIL